MGRHVPNNQANGRYSRHYMPRCFHFQHQRKIGLLGGSFNPAHDGHLALSEQARKIGKCDEIWWLVSPQNPLKSSDNMAAFETRLSYARELAAGKNWLRVLDIEHQAQLSKSVDIMQLLRRRAPKVQFIWLIGSDNLIQLPHWHEAKKLTYLMPFMVFRRGADFYPSLASKGRALWRSNHQVKTASHLFRKKPPALYIDTKFDKPISATKIRQERIEKRL